MLDELKIKKYKRLLGVAAQYLKKLGISEQPAKAVKKFKLLGKSTSSDDYTYIHACIHTIYINIYMHTHTCNYLLTHFRVHVHHI